MDRNFLAQRNPTFVMCLLVGVFCFFHKSAYSQYFSKVYDFDTTNEFGRNVILQPSGSYLVLAGGYRRKGGYDEVYSFVVSKDGSLAQGKKTYSVDRANVFLGDYGKMSGTSTGSFLFPFTAISYPSTYRAGILKLAPNGDSIFTRFYTDTVNFEEDAPDIAFGKHSQHYLLAIRSYDTAGYFGSAVAVLLITDTNGTLINRLVYEKKAGIPPTTNGVGTWLNSVEEDINGRILIGASNGNIDQKVIGGISSNAYPHMRPWFILADSAGKIIKDTSYGPEFAGGGNIRGDKSGGYLHWGTLDSFLTQNALNFQNLPDYVAHIDSNFRPKWIHTFGGLHSHTTIYKTIQLSNGDYLAMGFKQSDRTESHGGWAARLTRTGTVKWDRAYLIDSTIDPYLVDAAERPDGSLIMVGVSFRNRALPAYRGEDAWLLSVDSNGCELPGCSLTTAIPKVKNMAFTMFPNPAYRLVTINSPADGQLIILNTVGQIVQGLTIKMGENKIQLSDRICPGIYVVRLFTDEGVASQTLSIN